MVKVMRILLGDKDHRETVPENNFPVIRSHLLMLVATGFVATSFPVGAEITEGLDSLVLTFLRFALATILFAPVVAWRYGIALPKLRDLVRYGILSACLVGFFWGMFVALRLTSALNTAAIFSLTPAITVAVSVVLLKERLSKATLIALPIGVVGAIWVIFRGDLEALLSLSLGPGEGIFLMGTIAMGFYGPLVKYLHRGEPMAQMTFWTLATGAFWLFLLSASRFSQIEWTAIPTSVYGGIAYLAIFTTLVTFFLFQWSATVIGPTKVMSYTYLNPGLVLIIGVLFEQNVPPLALYPGLLLSLLATIVLQLTKPIAASSTVGLCGEPSSKS